jgi:hypothetical protein
MNDLDQPPLLKGPPPQPLLPAPDRDIPEPPPSGPTGRGASGRRVLGLGVLVLFMAAVALGVWRHTRSTGRSWILPNSTPTSSRMSE